MAQKLLGLSVNIVATRLLPKKCCTIPKLSYQYTVKRFRTSPSAHVANIASQPDELTTTTLATAATTTPDLLLTEEDRNDFFRLNNLFSVEDLFKARVHYGHKEGMLNGHMRPYIFGKRLGVLIIDLEETARLLKKALTIIAEISYRNGIVLFVSKSRQTGHLVEEAAKECGEYAYCRKWRNQVFSNSHKLFGAVTRLPDLVVMFTIQGHVGRAHEAVLMSAKMLIPTVGICDTDTDPKLITYPVPGNDDSPQSVELYCHLFKTAVLKGKEKRKEILEKYGEEFYNKTLEFSG